MTTDAVAFPTLAKKAQDSLTALLQILASDPECLNSPHCPYDPQFKAALSAFLGVGAKKNAKGEEGVTPLTTKNLTEFYLKVFRELEEYKKEIQAGDKAEMNTYFRLSVNLGDKILEGMERTANLEKVREFSDYFIQVMDDVLTPDQRTAIVRRLKNTILID